jgi:hypothetical protein
MTVEREDRIAAVVGAVARQALADRGVRRIALLDDGSPEASLAARFLSSALGEEAVIRVIVADAEVEPVLHLAVGTSPERVREEIGRMHARLVPGAITANPANKTALLLGGDLPPEPLLPLGDLWASEVAALAGDWSAPPSVGWLADACGGIEALDGALRAYVDRREPDGLGTLPAPVADEVRRVLEAGRPARLNPRIVPKVGTRTLGVDLFE